MLQLKNFPDLLVSTREEERQSRPHPEEPRFRLLAREEGSFPAWSGKNSRPSRRISSGGALHRKGERNSRVVPHSQSPPDVSVHSRETSFPCTASTFKPRIDSYHSGTRHSPVGKPRGKASWESLVRKPRRKAPDHLIHANGSATLLLQLGRKAHVHAPIQTRTDSPGETPEVPKVHVSTIEESSGSGTESTKGLRPWYRRERIPERHPSNSHGDWPFLRPPERVPVVPVVSREHLPQLEKIQEVLPSRRVEAHFR